MNDGRGYAAKYLTLQIALTKSKDNIYLMSHLAHNELINDLQQVQLNRKNQEALAYWSTSNYSYVNKRIGRQINIYYILEINNCQNGIELPYWHNIETDISDNDFNKHFNSGGKFEWCTNTHQLRIWCTKQCSKNFNFFT